MSDAAVIDPKSGATPEGMTPEAKARRRMRIQEYALPVVVIALILIGIAVKGDIFASTGNFENILIQASIAGVIAVGMTFVIATGGIDLSVGSTLAVSAIFGGLMATGGTWRLVNPFGSGNFNLVFPELGLFGFLLATLVFAAFIGAINGIAIVWLRIIPFIATLAMMTIGRGLSLNLSGKTPISLNGSGEGPNDLANILQFGSGRVFEVGPFPGIPTPALILIVVTVIGWVLLNRTRYGRYVVAVGGNAEAARIAGIRVRQIIFSVYVLVGLCAGIAAIILCGQLGIASPVSGNMLELQAIAAVAIGGTALAGGRATMLGTFFGVLTFAIIFNLLTLLGMPAELQQIMQGLIILVAVAVQRRES